MRGKKEGWGLSRGKTKNNQLGFKGMNKEERERKREMVIKENEKQGNRT